MSPEAHVLACALKVKERFGDCAPAYVASEIGRLALEGDVEGVEMWTNIAVELDSLRRPH